MTPDKPLQVSDFLKTSFKQPETIVSSPVSQACVSAAPSSVSVSPGKRIGLRTECMEQLDKWHSLLQKGVITEEQHKEHQQKILKDMTQF